MSRRPAPGEGSERLRIAFLHPDLGLGGAERLVIDAAMSLVGDGHDVTLYTTRHDSARCFPETRDGRLPVVVGGDRLPPHLAQRLRAPLAFARMSHLAWQVTRDPGGFDLFFCDGVAACVPLLRLRRTKVIFYCHYPDLLLAPRGSLVRRAYRWPLDRWEELGTASAHRVLVNSRYTAEVFRRTFPRLGPPEVLHPGTRLPPEPSLPVDGEALLRAGIAPGEVVLLALHRYAPEKNLPLALEALARLRELLEPDAFGRIRLVVAGGYDADRVEDRVTFQALVDLAERLGVAPRVSFLRSVPAAVVELLLARCLAVVYTPVEEHFGLVPIEAMAAGRPVVAADRGGPTETVIDGETGLLRPPAPEAFAGALAELVRNPARARALGRAGRQRVKEHFSDEAFARGLRRVLAGLLGPGRALWSSRPRSQ